jgi:hypothetical protein
MSVTTRLKKIEKQVSGSGASEEAKAKLMIWLSENHFNNKSETFHEWCERMPKRLIKSFVNYVRGCMPMGILNVGKDWVGI